MNNYLNDWKKPPQDIAENFSDGFVPELLLSWGPVTIYPGTSYRLIFAIVGGENLHVDPDNLANLPDNPLTFTNNLDFSDFVRNCLMAEWVYDNPGVDTDHDGYRGEFRVCVLDSILSGNEWLYTKADTQWYKGDGVPDLRGAIPPPAPEFWLTSVHNGIHVRFNGHASETELDPFLNISDFEGYHIYLGRDEREASLSLVASYDRENYDKYFLNRSLLTPEWQLLDIPFTLDDLRCLYGSGADPCADSTFDPLTYTRIAIRCFPMILCSGLESIILTHPSSA
jgi:hypothetical protein